MVRWLRRTIALAIITAIALTLVRRSRPVADDLAVAPPSAWPPFEPRGSAGIATETLAEPTAEPSAEAEADVVAPTAAVAMAESSAVTDWAEPIDGGCQDGYPIKANDNSHIFHVPGGRFYDRTRAERCYPTAEAAERDGYRRAKA